ncbi:UNVERIFIED_CONTAM: hypothetical protein GTU68_000433 [Idotea baltica]|nr:hypothetical protein [Idotea baltica]
MAEAFGHIYKTKEMQVYSAGSEASGTINPKAIAAMAKLGYDLSKHQSLPLEDLPNISFDYVVSMGCGGDCPHIPTANREDWQIPDPKHLSEKEYLLVRDYISLKVQLLVNSFS